MKKIIFFFLLSCALPAMAAGDSTKVRGKAAGGTLMLGMRTTTSLFSEAGVPGMGIGGQFRLRFFDRVNSDWFADYITSDIGGLGKRTDYHIGWSVLFYPFVPESPKQTRVSTIVRPKDRKLVPYVLAGHCFDYTRVSNRDPLFPHTEERWSSAIQAGLGTHWMLSRSFDLSLTSQYMMHLGGDVHAHVAPGPNGTDVLFIEKQDELSLEGHLLMTLSLNVRMADLWSR
ncbi:MAG: hypothetical protein FD123_1959 [Bacteroidetes bacterium]|nr:MAG: hypothetical protein FD123_1959 [Bacteroidota bacterium]